jgi:hypothetical protein
MSSPYPTPIPSPAPKLVSISSFGDHSRWGGHSALFLLAMLGNAEDAVCSHTENNSHKVGFSRLSGLTRE